MVGWMADRSHTPEGNDIMTVREGHHPPGIRLRDWEEILEDVPNSMSELRLHVVEDQMRIGLQYQKQNRGKRKQGEKKRHFD